MFKYKVQVKKVSGRLNESVLPSKNLVVKSKTKKSKNAVLAEASKFFKKKYGLVIESAEISEDALGISVLYRGCEEAMMKFHKEFGSMPVSEFISTVPNAFDFIDEYRVIDMIVHNKEYYYGEQVSESDITKEDIEDEIVSYSKIDDLIEEKLIDCSFVKSYYM